LAASHLYGSVALAAVVSVRPLAGIHSGVRCLEVHDASVVAGLVGELMDLAAAPRCRHVLVSVFPVLGHLFPRGVMGVGVLPRGDTGVSQQPIASLVSRSLTGVFVGVGAQPWLVPTRTTPSSAVSVHGGVVMKFPPLSLGVPSVHGCAAC
jgi:hypothetical protein